MLSDTVIELLNFQVKGACIFFFKIIYVLAWDYKQAVTQFSRKQQADLRPMKQNKSQAENIDWNPKSYIALVDFLSDGF